MLRKSKSETEKRKTSAVKKLKMDSRKSGVSFVVSSILLILLFSLIRTVEYIGYLVTYLLLSYEQQFSFGSEVQVYTVICINNYDWSSIRVDLEEYNFQTYFVAINFY